MASMKTMLFNFIASLSATFLQCVVLSLEMAHKENIAYVFYGVILHVISLCILLWEIYVEIKEEEVFWSWNKKWYAYVSRNGLKLYLPFQAFLELCFGLACLVIGIIMLHIMIAELEDHDQRSRIAWQMPYAMPMPVHYVPSGPFGSRCPSPVLQITIGIAISSTTTKFSKLIHHLERKVRAPA